MAWKVRHEGSPQARSGLTFAQVVEGLRDGLWEPTDEVMGPNEQGWTAIENHPQLAEVAEELEPPPVHRPDETHLDMTAMIDVCLVLLIFFILTTSYVITVQKVIPLAEVGKTKIASATAKQVRNQMVRVEADTDKNGKPSIIVENQKADVFKSDQQTLDADKLKQVLLPFTRGEQVKTDMMLDARDVTWGLVIAIQDAARSAGIRTVHHKANKK